MANSVKVLLDTQLPDEWKSIFKTPSMIESINTVSSVIVREKKIYGEWIPLPHHLTNCFCFPPEQITGVIIVDKPYSQMIHGRPRARGMALSVTRDDVISGMLQTMFDELCATIEGYKFPKHGDLTLWSVRDGILLLNASWTLFKNKSGDQGKVWIGINAQLMKALYDINPKTWVLLLSKQPALKSFLPKKMMKFECENGIRESNIFNLINEYRIKVGCEPYSWTVDEEKKDDKYVESVIEKKIEPITELIVDQMAVARVLCPGFNDEAIAAFFGKDDEW